MYTAARSAFIRRLRRTGPVTRFCFCFCLIFQNIAQVPPVFRHPEIFSVELAFLIVGWLAAIIVIVALEILPYDLN